MILSNKEVVNKDHSYVAEVTGCLVGFIYGETINNSTLLPQYMYVSEKHRKCGIGRKLMQKLEEESNCSVSLVYYNKSLHGFYQKQSYKHGSELEVATKQLVASDQP